MCNMRALRRDKRHDWIFPINKRRDGGKECEFLMLGESICVEGCHRN